MWDLPGPGLEPVSPALAGGFLTTAPPEESFCISNKFPGTAGAAGPANILREPMA